jgi:hypothetical protein
VRFFYQTAQTKSFGCDDEGSYGDIDNSSSDDEEQHEDDEDGDTVAMPHSLLSLGTSSSLTSNSITWIQTQMQCRYIVLQIATRFVG